LPSHLADSTPGVLSRRQIETLVLIYMCYKIRPILLVLILIATFAPLLWQVHAQPATTSASVQAHEAQQPAGQMGDDGFELTPVGGTHRSYAGPDQGFGVEVPVSPAGNGGPYESTRALRPQSSGLVINPTFDSSITGNPNSAEIEALIDQVISIFQSQFTTPITVSILFRYSPTEPNGDQITGFVSISNYATYSGPWAHFVTALRASATSANDSEANASLPSTPMSANIVASSANGRAVGLNTPPGLFADGHYGAGGPYDGIVTLDSGQPFVFSRNSDGQVPSGSYDAQRFTEHEIDEVLGLGSYLNYGGANLRPQDLFSWSSSGVRNLTSGGSRYFSIDSGASEIVGFSQDPSGDFGDWLSGSCPQTSVHVQNAFSCEGQVADISATSPEGINLDVIGYSMAAVDFSLSFDQATITTSPGTKVPVTVNIDRLGGLSGAVTVKPPTGLPAGIKVTGGAQSTTGNSVSYSIKVKKNAEAGSYQLAFTGNDKSGQAHMASLTLVVQ
jgi:hypothetical protein